MERLELTRQRGDVLTAELMNLKVKVAADAERREGIGAALKWIDDARREVDERRARLFAALSEADCARAELRSRLDGTRVDLERAGAGRRRGARGELSRARTEHEGRAVASRTRDAGGPRAAHPRRGGLGAAMGEAAATGREQALALTHLEEQTRALPGGAEVGGEPVSTSSGRRATPSASGSTKLKGQAERMGAINLTAIEEYDELASCVEFMSTQKGDLERLHADLKAAIVKINRASRERFQETFDRVNEKFQAVFLRPSTAGAPACAHAGGRDGEPGVEIFSQPPGKKLQSVNLLSGGEKALTAVSHLRHLPHQADAVLLDEVDAPLDDANVGYNDMVKEMSKASGSILITHNKRTMEMVDTPSTA